MFHGTTKRDVNQREVSQPFGPSTGYPQLCLQFEFPQIQFATKNFDETSLVGYGVFGKVYKGYISNGSSQVVAAIKLLYFMSSQIAAEFWAQLEVLSRIRHTNIASLIGYCKYGNEQILICEFINNGSLNDHLHRHGTSLSWVQRLKICIGAARGLDYFHTGVSFRGVHGNLTSSNILLDENWVAKISDIGSARIGPTDETYTKKVVKGTLGYIDPNYYTTGILTRKSDVYAFGVVLFEVLCRKGAVDSSLEEGQYNLAIWARESIKKGILKHIIDSDIRGQIAPKCLEKFVRIAETCLHSDTKQRATMAESRSSVWADIIRVGCEIDKTGVEFSTSLIRKIGSGELTSFWSDRWAGQRRLRDDFNRLYHLESNNEVLVCNTGEWEGVWKWKWEWSRDPRGRATGEVDELQNLLSRFSLSCDCRDLWSWSLSDKGIFSVKELSNIIDDKCFSLDGLVQETRWNKLVPKKLQLQLLLMVLT
ncbi:receptor-like protein kinase FERONIA [Tanacetum coccineum]